MRPAIFHCMAPRPSSQASNPRAARSPRPHASPPDQAVVRMNHLFGAKRLPGADLDAAVHAEPNGSGRAGAWRHGVREVATRRFREVRQGGRDQTVGMHCLRLPTEYPWTDSGVVLSAVRSFPGWRHAQTYSLA